jgi:tetratricopeptide (TPR) repeat protein
MHGRDLVRLTASAEASAVKKADTTSRPATDTASRTETVGSVRPFDGLRAAPSNVEGRLQPDQTADLYAETRYPVVAGWSPLGALTDGRWKAIRAGRTTELYDLQADPQEAHDIASAQAATAAAMAARIDTIGATGASAAKRAISQEAQDRLRSLGYVASSVRPAAPERAPTPAATIAAWNAFEDALSALNAGKNAVPALARLATDHPDAPIFQTTYARALKDAGRTADALEIYRRSAKRWPTDATLLHDLAVAARETAQSARGAAAEALQDEAARTERAAASIAPSSGIAHNGLGLIAADQGKPAEAAREFEQATALDPNNASYWTNLGNARRATGDAAGADNAYRHALDIDARAADAANGLGVLLVEARRPGEAVTWFERALAASPDLVEARLNLAIARQESGDKQGAAEAYRRVLAARGNHPREKEAAAKLLDALGAKR